VRRARTGEESEVRGQRSEGRGEDEGPEDGGGRVEGMAEVRGQRAEVRGQRAEVRGQKSEDGGQSSESEGRYQKSEAEDGGLLLPE
jgi:hypothetical protein